MQCKSDGKKHGNKRYKEYIHITHKLGLVKKITTKATKVNVTRSVQHIH